MKETKQETFLPLAWTEFEYTHSEKDANWFWYVGSGALLIVIIAILMHNFLFAAFAIVAAFAVIIMAAQKPKKMNFSIEDKGIKIGHRLYFYDELKSFWVNNRPPRKKELIIESGKILIPHIKIPLGNVDPDLARKMLLKKLKEKKQEESLTEIIAERLGF